MFLQAGGGGKGIRPIQQTQQTAQQQSQQHQNQVPTHHQAQSIITTSSNLQAHHLSSQASNHQQPHHGHQSQQQQQQQQQQQSSSHLSNIQPQILPQPHHQQTALQHTPHHHTAIPYYTYQLSQPPQPSAHTNHQQQQVPNNGTAATQPLVISSSGSASSGNGPSGATINGNNSNNNSGLLHQHSTGNSNIPTLYTPNTTLLQSPTATPGFMTPYMQQYPIQTAVIAAAAAAAQYPNNPQNNGSNNNSANGHNNQNNGPPQSVYQITQQTHQQQPIMQYFHPTAAGVAAGPTPTAPPHLHPNQPQFRSVLTSGHSQHHNGPPTYLLPAPPTTLYAMPSGQLTTSASQRASLLAATGQQQTGANGNIPISQLMQAATTPAGAATFMPAAFCTAPMGITHGAIAGTSPLLSAGAPLGPSPLQTYSHLTNVSMSSSNTSMSSLSEGNIKPRPHAIPIIDPITHENILDPKPLHKTTSVEVKPTAPEFTKSSNASLSTSISSTSNTDTDNKSSSTSVSSKWRDKSITVSIPPSKSVTSNSSTSGSVKSKEKTDQQMQTDVKREKPNPIKLENPKMEKTNIEKRGVSKANDLNAAPHEGDAANKQSEMKAHFPKKTAVGDNGGSFKEPEDEKLVIFLEEKKTYAFATSQKSDENDSIKTLEGDSDNVTTTYSEYCEDFEGKHFYKENRGSHESLDTLKTSDKPQKIIHDKGQQAFIPRQEKNSDGSHFKIPSNFKEQSVRGPQYSAVPTTSAAISKSNMSLSSDKGTSKTAAGSSNTSSPTKTINGRRQSGNKQNATSSAASSCSSISSNSGLLHDNLSNKSSSTLLPTGQDTTTFVKQTQLATSKSFHNQQQQSYKRQQQQQTQHTQVVQQSTKNTPTTSGASSSAASTPTHQLHQVSTDTSITPTPGNKRTRRNKRVKEQKKKNETNNRNQQPQQQSQKQRTSSNIRNGSNTNIYINSNNPSSSSNTNLNYNTNKNKKSTTNINNNNNSNTSIGTTTYGPANPTTNQTDNNNANSYNSTSCTNVSSSHNFRKNSLTSNYKPTQPLQQQQQQQQQYQQRYNTNNSSSNRSSRCSITFGGLSSDAGSLSEAESKASLTGYNSEMTLPNVKGNFSNENTKASSTSLSSPKKNHRHVRAREIVAQYLSSNATDSGSDKTNTSDEPSIQFLNSSSSACEDDNESMARLQYRKEQLKLEQQQQQLDHYQEQPLEFGIGTMALTEIDQVYFGDFPTEKDFTSSSKTDDDTDLDVTITKIFESQKSRKLMADAVDCVPIRTSIISPTSNEYDNGNNVHGLKKATVQKNDKADVQVRQHDSATTMRSGNANAEQSPKFFRYSFRDLKELASAPESCKPPMVRCQKDNCVAQLFVSRQQLHLSSHGTLSATALQQHLQQYQQINYNESMEFVSGKRRGGGGSSGADRLKKHEHLSGMTTGNNVGMMGVMSSGAGSSNAGQQQRKMDIIRVHLSLKEEIKLSECENAWTPDTLRGKSVHRSSSSTSNDDLEVVLKKVRGVLNKLTPNNFDVLLKTMTSISMNTQEKMQQVMLLIFEKTVSEPNFAPTYAKFCKVLFQEIKAESKSLFSTLLITRIQHEFESNVNDADAKQKKLQPLVDKLTSCTDSKERVELQAELEDQEYQFRRRAWGTVRFIGEMYKLQSLTSDRVLICIESLLKHGSEEKLEFMCKLLTTVGYILEAATPEQLPTKTRIDDIFRRMQEIVQRSRSTSGQQNPQTQSKISSRVRFMMQDVMDLRARHWDQQQRSANTSGGSTQSALSLQQQQQQQQQQQVHQQRRKDEKSHGNSSNIIGTTTHDKQQSRGYGGNVSGSQSSHRQLRGNNTSQSDNSHYFMQKSTKQHHQQQEQKVNIDVNKLKFTRGDETTPSSTKLGSSSLYLWRTAGRPSASNSSITTSVSASSSQQFTVSTQASSNSSLGGVGNSNSSHKRETTNQFEVLDRFSPTIQPVSSDGDDAFTDDTDDQSNNENVKYSGKECQQLINRLVEEMFDVTSGESSWQEETLSVWCKASAKQQVALLHYLLMDYLHLGSVKRQQREACAKIFKHLLVTPQVFNKVVFDEAYAQFGEEFPDLLVDVPDGWVYVFEFIGPILHADLLRFEDIWHPQWAEDTCFTERFLKAFINYFTHEYGANYTRDMWHHRYNLDRGQQFMFDEMHWQRFVSNNRYDYLLETKSTENKETGEEAECVIRRASVTKRCVIDDNEDETDPTKHIERIGNLLRSKNGTDLAMEYIISNVPINSDFLRGLTELFCCDIATSSNVGGTTSGSAATNNTKNTTTSTNTVNADKKERLKGKSARCFELETFRKKCLPVLRLCVDSNESLELSCLDAIFEILLDNYEEPKANKMICNVFDMFYHTELIPKDTFEKWYQTQSLVDDAIEAAGTSTITETQPETSSKTPVSSLNRKQSSQKKHHNKTSTQIPTKQESHPVETPDNNNNPHKISADLHAYMRQLLLKMWCKTPPAKQLVQ